MRYRHRIFSYLVARFVFGAGHPAFKFLLFGEKLLQFEFLDRISYRHVVTLGFMAGIGFTVALLVSTAAFADPGPTQDSALASFAAAFVAVFLGLMLQVRTKG